MEILVVGNSKFTHHVLRHLTEEHNLVGLVTNKSRKGNSILEDYCSKNQIEFISTDRIADIDEQLKELQPTIGLCAGWTEIIPTDILKIPQMGFVGLHASNLPQGRGGAPVNWSILQGQNRVGMSLFEFVEEVDAGDIIAQDTVEIEDQDDVKTVYDKLTWLSFDLLNEGLENLTSRKNIGVPQETNDASYRPQRKPEDGIIEWNRTNREIYDWVRALTHPYPGAFTFHDNNKLKIWKSSLASDSYNESEPGVVLEVEDQLVLSAERGGIVLERVQLDDYPEMWGNDYADMMDLKYGDKIGNTKDYPDGWLYTGIRDADGGYQFDTDYIVGEDAILTANCFSKSETRINVNWSIDGEYLDSVEIEVNGWTSQRVRVPLEKTGSHTITLTFLRAEEEVDRRHMIVYATES